MDCVISENHLPRHLFINLKLNRRKPVIIIGFDFSNFSCKMTNCHNILGIASTPDYGYESDFIRRIIDVIIQYLPDNPDTPHGS